MALKYYFPLSVGIFALAVAVPRYFSVPVAPFVVLVLFAETLLGFQVEDHRVPRFVKALFASEKHGH